MLGGGFPIGLGGDEKEEDIKAMEKLQVCCSLEVLDSDHGFAFKKCLFHGYST